MKDEYLHCPCGARFLTLAAIESHQVATGCVILTCPFCACTPTLDSGKNSRYCWATISCQSSVCHIQPLCSVTAFKTKTAARKEVIRRWNVRNGI